MTRGSRIDSLLSPSSSSFPAPFLLLTRGVLSLKPKSQMPPSLERCKGPTTVLPIMAKAALKRRKPSCLSQLLQGMFLTVGSSYAETTFPKYTRHATAQADPPARGNPYHFRVTQGRQRNPTYAFPYRPRFLPSRITSCWPAYHSRPCPHIKSCVQPPTANSAFPLVRSSNLNLGLEFGSRIER